MSRLLRLLNAEPINCGNCLHLKVYKKSYRFIAKCNKGLLVGSGNSEGDKNWWFISNLYGKDIVKLPSAWRKAKGCPKFYSMID